MQPKCWNNVCNNTGFASKVWLMTMRISSASVINGAPFNLAARTPPRLYKGQRSRDAINRAIQRLMVRWRPEGHKGRTYPGHRGLPRTWESYGLYNPWLVVPSRPGRPRRLLPLARPFFSYSDPYSIFYLFYRWTQFLFLFIKKKPSLSCAPFLIVVDPSFIFWFTFTGLLF